MKSFCKAKDTINKTKKHNVDWEKLFLNNVSDKKLISKTHKELKNLGKNKPNTQLKSRVGSYPDNSQEKNL